MLASGKLRLFAAAAHGRRRKQLQHPCWAPIKCTVVTASFTSFVLLSPAFPRQTPPHASTSQTSLVASCSELTSPALSCALTLVTPEHRIEACKRYSEYHSLRRFWQNWEEDDEEEEFSGLSPSSDPHAVSYVEAISYYSGLPSQPRLVYRTGAPWSPPCGPEAYRRTKELREVYDHPLVALWNDGLAWKVVEILDAHGVSVQMSHRVSDSSNILTVPSRSSSRRSTLSVSIQSRTCLKPMQMTWVATTTKTTLLGRNRLLGRSPSGPEYFTPEFLPRRPTMRLGTF